MKIPTFAKLPAVTGYFSTTTNIHLNAILFIEPLILEFIGIAIGLGFLLYVVVKQLGYPRAAKYLIIAYGLLILAIGFYIVFEDQLFTKNNAKELVEEQEILLEDKFELRENESSSAIGDYYHTFTLEISERDKQHAILNIKSSANFKKDYNSIDQMPYLSDQRYFGPKVTRNYETVNAFVREYFQPSGQEGYAPTFRRISISKTKNELIFEDMNK